MKVNLTKVGIALIVCGALIGSAVAVPLITSLLIHTGGNISIIQASTDAAGTHVISTLDWGNCTPGVSTNQTLYLKNLGATTLNVSLSFTHWSPTNASNYLTITWDREGYALAGGFAIQCTLALFVNATVTDPVLGMGTGTFNVDLVFTGTQ